MSLACNRVVTPGFSVTRSGDRSCTLMHRDIQRDVTENMMNVNHEDEVAQGAVDRHTAKRTPDHSTPPFPQPEEGTMSKKIERARRKFILAVGRRAQVSAYRELIAARGGE